MRHEDELTEELYQAIRKNINELDTIAVQDTTSPITNIIRIDIVDLLTKAVKLHLREEGSIGQGQNFVNGLAVNLEKLEMEFSGGRLTVTAIRDKDTTEAHESFMKEFLEL